MATGGISKTIKLPVESELATAADLHDQLLVSKLNIQLQASGLSNTLCLHFSGRLQATILKIYILEEWSHHLPVIQSRLILHMIYQQKKSDMNK